MTSKSAATIPNQGGEVPETQAAAKQRLSCTSIACPHHNDKHKHLKRCSLVLIILLFVLLALEIAATQQTLAYAPYAPIGIVMIVACILFWVFAIAEITIFSVLTKKTIQEHSIDGHGYEKKHWCRRYVLERWTCLALAIAVVGSLVMLFLILTFLFPESFYGTGSISIHRMGSVSATSATFFIREPSARGTFVVEYRPVNSGPFLTSDPVGNFSDESDHTSVVVVNGLVPGTAYEWKFNSDSTLRQFKTPPTNSSGSEFTFVFGSCFMFNFPYQLGSTGFEHVAALNPDFILNLGDIIYADVPIYRGGSVGDFNSLYRQNFRNKGFNQAFTQIPSFHMWDDHEIYNDWDNPSERDGSAYQNAIEVAWSNYIGKTNPSSSYSGENVYYFNYDYAGASFFVLDTRSFRSRNDATDGPNKTLIGSVQMQRVKDWLIDKNSSAVFKFIASPVGWTSDFKTSDDSWGGHTTDRLELLNYIRDNRIGGVLFLSGDAHFPYAIELFAPGSGLYEFSNSPFDAFDFDLGGYSPASNDPFKPEEERTGRLLWTEIGGRGSVSYISTVRVNTIANPPFVHAEWFDRDKMLFNLTLTLDQINTVT